MVHTTGSINESEKEKTTIKMNWGEARFAGETVRHNHLSVDGSPSNTRRRLAREQ